MKRLRKKTAILIILAIVFSISSVTAVVTYAAYTNSKYAQRTIANYESNGDRFRSNVLIKTDDPEENIITILTTDGNNAFSRISIRNHEKVTLPYGDDINYTLTAKLVRKKIQLKSDDSVVADGTAFDSNTMKIVEEYVDATADYISANSLTAYTATVSDGTTTLALGGPTNSEGFKVSGSFSSTLTGGEASTDVYTVTMSEYFAKNKPNLYLWLKAEPNITTLPTLGGVCEADYQVERDKDSWTGTFSDDTATAPSAYDGFNYRIAGVGKGRITLQWDSSKVTLSYMSRKLLEDDVSKRNEGKEEGEEVFFALGANSLTMDVDSDDTSVYDLQFYKMQPSDTTWSWESTDWDDMNGEVVTFEFVAES